MNGEILRDQKPLEKDFIAQVLRNTAWLSEQLKEKLGTKVWIKPILVFANAGIPKFGADHKRPSYPESFSAEYDLKVFPIGRSMEALGK